jgi:tetratricopeptide (TPR) repeat protein
MMLRLLVSLVGAAVCAAQPTFDVSGRITPAGAASVTLYGTSSPFSASTLAGEDGRFSFKKLKPAAYTIAVFMPARGEARQTVVVGPGTADGRGRVALNLFLKDSDFVFKEVLRRRNSISAKQLAIPDKALREYEQAQKSLSRHEIETAIRHLERAVEIAPQFSAAWNNLGTIAYQTRRFPKAEEYFRESLEQDPDAYEPLVNLGGVLINLNQLDEAWKYNVHAVLTRPNDPLANAQLGQTYFGLNKTELAEKYLVIARNLDPAHFSHPQLFLAEIRLRRGDKRGAADELEDFLKRHPDWPTAEKVREGIAGLRK